MITHKTKEEVVEDLKKLYPSEKYSVEYYPFEGGFWTSHKSDGRWVVGSISVKRLDKSASREFLITKSTTEAPDELFEPAYRLLQPGE